MRSKNSKYLQDVFVVNLVDLVHKYYQRGDTNCKNIHQHVGAEQTRHRDLPCLASRMCSRVWGIGPSVDDTTRMPPSICAAPVIMFLT
jgi:hypothetical protein